jgi:hypothetical protein
VLWGVKQVGEVGGDYISGNVNSLELSMNASASHIPLRICADPAIVVNSDMERLRSVRYIMTQPPSVEIENDLVLDKVCRLMKVAELSVFSKRILQPPEDFHHDIELEADPFGEVIVRVIFTLRSLLIKLLIKLVPPFRQLFQPSDSFQINVMVRLLCALQRRIGVLSPSVGFRA